MTTEEKAKAYDMALEGARKELGVDRKEWEVVQRVLHNIFPELKESEDERIRKDIIKTISWIVPDCQYAIVLPREQKNEWLAYLEKQKERGPLTKEEERTLQDIILHLEDEGCPTKWKDLLHDIYNLPYTKQKEQKPVEWKPSEEQMEALNKARRFIPYNCDILESLYEQLKKL